MNSRKKIQCQITPTSEITICTALLPIFCVIKSKTDRHFLLSPPIPYVVPEKQAPPIIERVDQILNAQRADSDADTTSLEDEIDKLVYQLYNLTEDRLRLWREKNEKRSKDFHYLCT